MNQESEIGHQNILEVDSLNLRLGRGQDAVHLLKDISFVIPRGKSIALLGQSGSGKSLTVLSILSLLPPYLVKKMEGQVNYFDGQFKYSLLGLNDSQWQEIRGRKISMIFQDPANALNPVKKCGNQILESIHTHLDLHKTKAKEKVEVLLVRVGFEDPSRIFSAYPHELSGGQLQRVLIAMALAANPRLLIADEPTTNLDAESKEEILILLESLKKKENISLCYITHDIEEARRMTDHIVYLSKGQLVDSQNTLPVSEKKEIRKKISNRQLISERILFVKKLYKSYRISTSFFGKGTKVINVLNGLDLEVFKGQIVGIIGKSGTGKTTLGRTILNLEISDGGEVLFNGKDILKISEKELRAVRQKLQIVYQNPYNTLNPRMKIIDIVQEPIRVHKQGKSNSDYVSEAVSILKRVGIPANKHEHYMYQLSGGQRQRVAIARALVLKPEFVVLDECVSSLDSETQSGIIDLLVDLKQDLGLSYLFISHDEDIVKEVSDVVYKLENGKLVDLS